MQSNSEMDVWTVVDEDDVGAGGVHSRSEMNSLKAAGYKSQPAQRETWSATAAVLTLRLLKHGNIISILMWQTPQKAIQIKPSEHPVRSLLSCRRQHKLSVGVEKAGEATDEGARICSG